MAQDLLYYTVSIAAVSGSAPADGFIDNLSATSYVVPGTGAGYDMETGWPTNLANAQARARANLRWKAVVEQLSRTVSPYSVSNITATGASNSSPATSMDFTVVYDRPDYVYAYDELNAGVKIYNDHAIKRWIARALCETIVTNNYPVLDPTAFSSPNLHYGPSLQSLTAGPLCPDIATAESNITITFVADVSGATYYPIT